MSHLRRPLLYGLLTITCIIGVAALVYAAIPQGASVLYTASDVVTMPAGTTFNAQILNALGALTASSSFTAGGTLAYSGDITPAQLTTNQDNYNPTGLSTAAVLRLSSNASWSITGLQGGADGRVLLIENVGSQNIVLAANSASSTAANRFDFPADVTMPPKALVLLKYDATSALWRTISPTLTGAAVRATTLTLAQQSGDPSPPASDDWLIYAKATGIHIRDDLGNITGPLGTGGGGGGGGIGMTAALVTTSNITLSGEQTFETVTTSASRVFVVGQTTPTQNGFYITSASAWTRASDALAGAAFTAGTLVTITNGLATSAGNRGSTWMFITSGTYGSSTLTAVKTGLGPAGELAAQKGASSGYPSLGTDSKLTWTQHGSRATHTPVAIAGQITPTATTMGVEGSGGNVTMTSGTPRITGCTGVADHGKKLTLRGISTNLLTMPNGQGVRLCGNAGSVVFGLNKGAATFTCEGNLPEWQQDNCLDMQQVANVGRSVIANESTPFIIATDTGGTNRLEAYIDSGTNKASLRAIAGGSPATATELTNPQIISTSPPTCSSTYPGLFKRTAGGAGVADTVTVCAKNASDIYGDLTILGAGAGSSTKAIFFPGAALEPDGANCHAHETVTMNNGPKLQMFKCDKNAASVFYGNVSMLNSGWQATAISLTLHVFHTTTETITFAGDFAVQCHAAGETVDNTWSSPAAANVAITTANRIPRATASSITPAGTCAVDDNLFFKYTVNATSFSTTAANSFVYGVTLTYTSN